MYPTLIQLTPEQLAATRAIYKTDLSLPLADNLTLVRHEMTQIRGRLSDLMSAFPGWKERMDHVEGLLTCGIIALHSSIKEVRECEVAINDRKFGPSLPFSPRGIGSDTVPSCFVSGKTASLYDNIAAFVASKEDGEQIVKWFSGSAWLDYRPHEPQRIQVKVGVCHEYLPNLQRLMDLTSCHGRIRERDIEEARKVCVAGPVPA